MARGPSGPAFIPAVSVPVMARGPSSERALRRGPSYDFPLSHSWRAARAGPLTICYSCFIAPALARGLSSERALRRRPSSHFPFCLISALPSLMCVSALHGRGNLVILSRMVTHAVTSMPKTAKMRMRSAASSYKRLMIGPEPCNSELRKNSCVCYVVHVKKNLKSCFQSAEFAVFRIKVHVSNVWLKGSTAPCDCGCGTAPVRTVEPNT